MQALSRLLETGSSPLLPRTPYLIHHQPKTSHMFQPYLPPLLLYQPPADTFTGLDKVYHHIITPHRSRTPSVLKARDNHVGPHSVHPWITRPFCPRIGPCSVSTTPVTSARWPRAGIIDDHVARTTHQNLSGRCTSTAQSSRYLSLSTCRYHQCKGAAQCIHDT